ncbi:MAG TPA: hypothetical protein VHC72_02370, partial [Bryobacteraceae bacterium]|nr:hypothetical protein [Bryobacteraceae bacterium]
MQTVLAQFAPDARLFESAEGGACVEDVVTIHPDRSRANAVRDGVGFSDIASSDAGGETVRGGIGA